MKGTSARNCYCLYIATQRKNTVSSSPGVLLPRRHRSLWFSPVRDRVLVWTLQSPSLFQSGKAKTIHLIPPAVNSRHQINHKVNTKTFFTLHKSTHFQSPIHLPLGRSNQMHLHIKYQTPQVLIVHSSLLTI